MGVPHIRTGWGYPLSGLDGIPPPLGLDGGTPWSGLDEGAQPPVMIEQQSEHLLRGERYASCVHAGGLSCMDL